MILYGSSFYFLKLNWHPFHLFFVYTIHNKNWSVMLDNYFVSDVKLIIYDSSQYFTYPNLYDLWGDYNLYFIVMSNQTTPRVSDGIKHLHWHSKFLAPQSYFHYLRHPPSKNHLHESKHAVPNNPCALTNSSLSRSGGGPHFFHSARQILCSLRPRSAYLLSSEKNPFKTIRRILITPIPRGGALYMILLFP